MPRPVYSVRFYAAFLTSAGTHIAFTVPAGHTYVLKSATFFSGSAGDAFLNDAGLGVPLHGFSSSSGDEGIDWFPSHVWEAGDSCSVQVNSGTWVVLLSGYDLADV